MIPLLIAGHGTADPEGAEQFRAFVRRVGTRLDVPVAGGFIELSAPALTDAVGTLVDTGATRLAAVPLMLVAAGHAKGDIPAALARERTRRPGLSVAYGRPLGPHPAVLDLNRVLCPSGAFAWTVGGVRVRSDGLHITPDGVRAVVAPWLSPQLATAARAR